MLSFGTLKQLGGSVLAELCKRGLVTEEAGCLQVDGDDDD